MGLFKAYKAILYNVPNGVYALHGINPMLSFAGQFREIILITQVGAFGRKGNSASCQPNCVERAPLVLC